VLALYALALQLVFSFGHIHPSDIFGPSANRSTLAQQQGAPPAPDRQAPALPNHEDCAICVTMAMAAGTALPAPVMLPPPSVVAAIVIPPPLWIAVAFAPRLPFRSRAPPRA
jgi:hypothetical protein